MNTSTQFYATHFFIFGLCIGLGLWQCEHTITAHVSEQFRVVLEECTIMVFYGANHRNSVVSIFRGLVEQIAMLPFRLSCSIKV